MQATNKQIKSTAAISQNQKQVIINLEALLGGVQNSIDCLIVLNSEKEKQLLPKLVSAAKNIIIADGGANYFYLSTSKDSPKLRCIIGDFDSIQDHVKQYFQKKGVNVCHDNDQDSTDLDKALKRAFNEGYKNIVCLGAFGGRMDHTLSALSVTSRINREYANTQIVLIGGANLMTLLRPKQHYRLRISDQIVTKSGNGLITFSKAQNIETTGFKWNLGTKHGLTELEWGKFLSTSNQILEKELTIYSSQELFFICQLKHQSGPFTKL